MGLVLQTVRRLRAPECRHAVSGAINGSAVDRLSFKNDLLIMIFKDLG
jgi:hypothetical protein